MPSPRNTLRHSFSFQKRRWGSVPYVRWFFSQPVLDPGPFIKGGARSVPRIDSHHPPAPSIIQANMSCTDTVAAPFWQATLENSRAQSRAWNTSAASTLVVATSSGPQEASSSRAGSAGASRHEPGHDLAAHGDLERHCGTPWFS